MNKEQIICDMLPNRRENKFKSALNRLFFGEKSYLWLSFIVPAVIMFIIYLALDIHPFGDGSVLVLDLNAQYVYFYEALREFVWGDESLLYSFSRQLGGEFMGIYAYYIASPLSYLVALFPKGKILEALLFIFILKTGLCGLSFGYYLHKNTETHKLKKSSVVAFSMMYALCAYAIVQQNNSMWIDALIWLPLLTYGIEQLIKKRKFKLYVISLAMSLMSNYYIGYMMCIYSALYFFYYYFAKSEKDQNNLIGEKTHFAKSLLRMIVYSILGIGISAVIVLTAYYSLTFGKTTFTDPSWKFVIRADIMDYLTKFLPGSYDTVRRAGLPFVYCGTLTLLMLPVYFISNKISNREKAMSGLFIIVFMLSFMINVVDLVWHGFQEPNWLNYRYSFMLSFLLLVMAYKGFEDVEAVSGKVHLATAGFISLFLIIAQKYVFKSYNSEQGAKLDTLQTIAFTFACLAAYLVILGVYKKAANRQGIAILMIFVVSLELFANGISNVAGLAEDVVYSSYSSYNDFMDKIRPIVEDVQKSDTSFYRMEKINHRRTNDNMALSIRGLSNSSSTLNRETIELLRHMGYASASHKSTYYGGNPVSDSILGIRYIIGDNAEINENAINENANIKLQLENYYELYKSDANYNAYYNPYALSIAYGTSANVIGHSFVTDQTGKDIAFNPYQKLNEMMTLMLGSEETVEVFKPLGEFDIATSNSKVSSIEGHYKYSPDDADASCSVTYTFTATRDGDVYFYLPSRYPREVTLAVCGDKYGTFYGQDTNRAMLIGNFKEGDDIVVKMTLKSDVLYVKKDVPTFYYLDDALFEDCFNKLSKTQMVIDDEYKEDHITGTIRTWNADQTIMTTIPYDEGWKVLVDGEEVEISKSFDALISFNIENEGEHTIEFIYRSKAFVLGISCSAVSLLVYILLIVFEKPIYSFIYKKVYDEAEETEEIDDTDFVDDVNYTLLPDEPEEQKD